MIHTVRPTTLHGDQRDCRVFLTERGSFSLDGRDVYAGERSPRNLFQAFVIMLSMSRAEVVYDEEKRNSSCDVS